LTVCYPDFILQIVTAGADWYEDVSLPALLRAGRSTFGSAIRHALEQAGFDDVPPNGSFVLGAMNRTGAPLGQIIKSLRASKQSTGQLVDTLVARGYIERSVDPEDRRRQVVHLTERGRSAAIVVRKAVDLVEADLAHRVGTDAISQARMALGALATMEAEERP
jgi:DNA-binding MarR family transcriptional regulator